MGEESPRSLCGAGGKASADEDLQLPIRRNDALGKKP